MNLPEDIKIFSDLFEKQGLKLYVVGGAVRDYLLGKVPNDYDLTTNADPVTIKNILSEYNTDLQGEHFGIVRVFTKSCLLGYEIASFRSDVSFGRDTKGEDKKVEIGSHITIDDDCQRRDFTQNALYFDISVNKVIDLVGGVSDINNKILRTVGSAKERFIEDRLRILRCIRFAAVSKYNIDTEIIKAIQADNRLFNVSEKEDVSKERIYAEYVKVEEKAVKLNDAEVLPFFFNTMFEFGILHHIYPEFNISNKIDKSLNLTLTLSQILINNTVDKKFKAVLADSKLPNSIIDVICFLVEFNNISFNVNNVYQLKKEMDRLKITPELLSEWFDIMQMVDKYKKLFINYKPFYTGKDMLELGYNGVEIGEQIRIRETKRFLFMI